MNNLVLLKRSQAIDLASKSPTFFFSTAQAHTNTAERLFERCLASLQTDNEVVPSRLTLYESTRPKRQALIDRRFHRRTRGTNQAKTRPAPVWRTLGCQSLYVGTKTSCERFFLLPFLSIIFLTITQSQLLCLSFFFCCSIYRKYIDKA